MADYDGVSTHVLDLTLGRPASGVGVALVLEGGGGAPELLARAVTDGEGRVRSWRCAPPAADGALVLEFETDAYFRQRGVATLYPRVRVPFVREGAHTHIPLLLSPFGYTTYRGV